MRMELFSIGPFTIYSYGLMIAVGILVCIAMGMYRAKKRGMSDDAVLTIAIIGVLSGFIGAKLLYVIVEFDQFIEDPMSVMGGEGFVVYGGIIVGVLSAVIYCRQKKLVFLEYFDLLAPSIAVAQGFGRIGCFLAGCCYGRETDLSGTQHGSLRGKAAAHSAFLFGRGFSDHGHSSPLQQKDTAKRQNRSSLSDPLWYRTVPH